MDRKFRIILSMGLEWCSYANYLGLGILFLSKNIPNQNPYIFVDHPA